MSPYQKHCIVLLFTIKSFIDKLYLYFTEQYTISLLFAPFRDLRFIIIYTYVYFEKHIYQKSNFIGLCVTLHSKIFNSAGFIQIKVSCFNFLTEVSKLNSN